MTPLRNGFTTGACAAAAAKAAVMTLLEQREVRKVSIGLPDQTQVTFPVHFLHRNETRAEVAVQKDAGDDPDVTDKALVIASVEWMEGTGIVFAAGEGVGTVTKPGLALPPGEPAINPGPRKIISQAIREATSKGVKVTVSIPGGRELAQKTFNPRLGISGGLSVLGTSGRVRPYSAAALKASLKCGLDVAEACGNRLPALTPGNIGERAARRHFHLSPEQVVQVSNHWGFMLDEAAKHSFDQLLAVGHPGKLAKVAADEWDTHSSHSSSAVPQVSQLAEETLQIHIPDAITVEGIFEKLSIPEQKILGDTLAARIRWKIEIRMKNKFPIAVVLINLAGDLLGHAGDLSPWLERTMHDARRSTLKD